MLRSDRELRNLLDSSVGYSPHLLYALVADRSGRIVLHTESDKQGRVAPPYPSLAALVDLDPVSRFRELYEGARTYEATLPLTLNGAPFGSIRLGVSTTLLRRELGASLRQSLTLAGIALPLAWVAAMILARVTLRPVRALAGEVDRIRRGEFSAEPDARRRRRVPGAVRPAPAARPGDARRPARHALREGPDAARGRPARGRGHLPEPRDADPLLQQGRRGSGRPAARAGGRPAARRAIARLPSAAPPGRGRARGRQRAFATRPWPWPSASAGASASSPPSRWRMRAR